MAESNILIVDAFIEKAPLQKRWLQRYNGTPRLSFDDQGVLWSYERMPLAIWLKQNNQKNNDLLLINGDAAPSNTTSKQQSLLQRHVEVRSIPHAIIPFSAMAAAKIISFSGWCPNRVKMPDTFKIIHTTPAKLVDRWIPCRGRCVEHNQQRASTAKNGHDYLNQIHFLGECLFKFEDRYFVCGLDRNDNPGRRHFYLSRLPKNTKPKTVDAALFMLKPKLVSEDALRQGEYFFTKTTITDKDVKKQNDFDVFTSLLETQSNNEKKPRPGIPIVSTSAKQMKDLITELLTGKHYNKLVQRQNRHRVSRMAFKKGDLETSVYVSGIVRDANHDPVKLGKDWFRVEKNLADGSWNAAGTVD